MFGWRVELPHWIGVDVISLVAPVEENLESNVRVSCRAWPIEHPIEDVGDVSCRDVSEVLLGECLIEDAAILSKRSWADFYRIQVCL